MVDNAVYLREVELTEFEPIDPAVWEHILSYQAGFVIGQTIVVDGAHVMC